ncbi:MAG TPA: glycosyltransferase [Bacteroidota bacterium]|nr:glycosyltransferase [Bacteroidota bacterium]
MNDSKRISIIIPTLQEETVLHRTLEQFTDELRHRFHIEIIISDGGSTDGTLAIARLRSDIVLEYDPAGKQNISSGRNRGAAVARGDILFFLNADVLIEDTNRFFSLMVETIQCGDIAAATCNVNIYPEEASMLDWIFHNCFNGYFWFLNLVGMGMGRGECHVIRKNVFASVGGYNEAMAAGEDYDLFLRIDKIGKIKFVRSLTVFESPRRFRKYGYIWISFLWFVNALSVFLFRKSIVDEWKPIR